MKKLLSAAEDSWVRVWHLSLTPETNSVEVKPFTDIHGISNFGVSFCFSARCIKLILKLQ